MKLKLELLFHKQLISHKGCRLEDLRGGKLHLRKYVAPDVDASRDFSEHDPVRVTSKTARSVTILASCPRSTTPLRTG